MAPSASFSGKCWPIESYEVLIRWLLSEGKGVVILEDPEKKKVKSSLCFGKEIAVLSGKLSLLQSAALLRHCQLAIGNDTAIVHMAEAMGIPAIAIFGPTVTEFGYKPFLPKSLSIEIDLPCRPCSRTGKGSCHLQSKRLCLTSIKPQAVIASVQSILNPPPPN